MARKVRIFVEDSPQHIILKGLDKLAIFRDEPDYRAFIEIIKESNQNGDLALHAYVLMPHFFEFLATPAKEDSLAKFMQSLGRKYVGYYNKKYNRTGTIFEGRYRASLVESELYLFDVMHYIEKLSPKGHLFSSKEKNLYGKRDALITCHRLYKELGYTDEQRLQRYGALIRLDADAFIALSLEKQSITASEDFVKDLERVVGFSLALKARGRPKKEEIIKGKKMYKNLTILDKEKHKDLKINPLEDLNFAKSAPHIPLLANEVTQVGAAFPVVFTAGETPELTAIVSLGSDSLAINEEGKWITSYVPSYLRKYPFSLASTKENPEQKVILIDEDSSLFSKSKGKQLFKKGGEKSETLDHAINFLTSYDNQMSVTLNVAKLISDSGILEEREISVGEGEEKKVLVNGFKVVNREKLNALSDDILADWVRKGIMTMIDAHIKSLDNIQTLFEIAQRRQS